MSCGNLVKVLLHTKVTRYLEFKSIAGSYVVKDKKVHKVPSTAAEALSSGLMGLFQKRYYKNFLDFVYKCNPEDPKTCQGLDLSKVTAKELYAKFSCDENTQAFTGHAVALYQNDDYLAKPAKDFVERVKLYAFSIARYGNSPYIYPIWGLGGLPEGFSRLCAIHGGTFMLNKPITKILYDKDGKVRGVESEGKEAYCKQLIADPSYFLGTDKIKKNGQVARCIAILSKPVANTNEDSAQIIIPAKQIKDRKSDIYVCMTSYHHKIAAEGKYVAVMSAVVEGKEIPSLEKDAKACEAGVRAQLADALALVGKPDQLFFWVSDSYVAVDPTGKKDNVFISSTYDATTHFESTATEVLAMYEAITGKKIDLTISTEPDKLRDPDEPEAEAAEATEEAAAPAKKDELSADDIDKALQGAEDESGAAPSTDPQ
jgi:Rab GDP dissociation inhibitor